MFGKVAGEQAAQFAGSIAAGNANLIEKQAQTRMQQHLALLARDTARATGTR